VAAASLLVSALSKRFERTAALSELSVDAQRGEFVCIVGPTNAGKSTLLKTIAGIHRPDAGAIWINGRDVTRLPPKDRNVSLLFQNLALFPTMTGFENIAFPMRIARVRQAEVEAGVSEVARLLRIEHVLHRRPSTFSGGEQQRVAIGRAIVHRADVLMLDEPLTNLDANIRIALRIELKKLHRELGQTVVYVTHDQVEAMSLSARIAVLHEGRLQQFGTPDEVYNRPANRFVAQFMGSPPMNILEVELSTDQGAIQLAGDGFRIPLNRLPRGQGFSRLPREVAVGVRPEAVRVKTERSPETPFAGEVFWVERLGGKNILDVRLGRNLIKVVVKPSHAASRRGLAWFGFSPEPHHLLDRATGVFFQ
jgi:ABC-type sugar transport system ATPase subunit